MIALIVDDEPINRIGLRQMLQKNRPDIDSILEAESSDKARKVFQSVSPDIVLLDINMPGENGFELLDSLKAYDFLVVFVTAYSEFAIRAFKANAIDYILKPVESEDLINAVEKCKALLALKKQPGNVDGNYQALLQNTRLLIDSKGYPEKITLPHHQGFNIIETDNIVYISADGNYSELYLSSNTKLVVTKAIREFEFMLNPDIFFRSHKSILINLRFVKEYSSVDGHYAILKNGTKLMISRRRLEEFMIAIDKLSSRV